MVPLNTIYVHRTMYIYGNVCVSDVWLSVSHLGPMSGAMSLNKGYFQARTQPVDYILPLFNTYIYRVNCTT